MQRNAVPLRDRFDDSVADEYSALLPPPAARYSDPAYDPFPGALSREETAAIAASAASVAYPDRAPPDAEFSGRASPDPAHPPVTASPPPARAEPPAGSEPPAQPPASAVRLADRAATLARATGSTDARVQGWLVGDLAPVLARTAPPETGGARLAAPGAGADAGPAPGQSPDDRLIAAVSALCEISPRDAMEGMLAAQMVAVHASALDCLRSAAAPGLTGRDRHLEFRDAARLLNLYERQLKLRDDRRNPVLARSIAGRNWTGPGGRHYDDHYGSGTVWGSKYWVSARAKPARVRNNEDAGR